MYFKFKRYKVFKAIDFFIKKHQHYLNLTNKYQILQQTFQYVPSRVIEYFNDWICNISFFKTK